MLLDLYRSELQSLGEIPLELEDSRDATAFPDYDPPNQSTFVDRLNYAPWPDVSFVPMLLRVPWLN